MRGRQGREREGGREGGQEEGQQEWKAATEERGSVRASEPRLMHVYVMCGYAGAGKVPSSLQNEHDDHETNLQPTTEERHTTHDLRPATGDPLPATCDRRPATCNVASGDQDLRFHLSLNRTVTSECPAQMEEGVGAVHNMSTSGFSVCVVG